MEDKLEQCNGFVLIFKPNGKVSLGFDMAKLKKTLIRPIYTLLRLNNILSRMAGL